MLDHRHITLFFDYVDPGSYVTWHVLERREIQAVDYRGYEVRLPSEPALSPRDPVWADYQQDAEAAAVALGIAMSTPRFIPHTRKAHELTALARENHEDCHRSVVEALFRAHFERGVDIGRIDRLVDVASAVGLDRSEVKAALDVDRLTAAVESDRAMGEERGIVGVPTLERSGERLEGLRSPGEIEAWLGPLVGPPRP